MRRIHGCSGFPEGVQQWKRTREDAEKDVNMIYYRLGDIYLMKAEALTELGQIIEANRAIEPLRIRANAGHSPLGSIYELQLFIVEERGREFALEGKRWFDILRYAKRNGFEQKQYIIDMVLRNVEIQRQAILRPRLLDTMSYYLPVPEADILYNPEMVQNPYYDR